MRSRLVLAACLAACPQLAHALPHPRPAAGDGLVRVQDAPAPVDGGATRSSTPDLTPQIEADVRGQTTTFTKPLAPVGPARPQGPRAPTRLFVTPGTAAGPATPQGLPR